MFANIKDSESMEKLSTRCQKCIESKEEHLAIFSFEFGAGISFGTVASSKQQMKFKKKNIEMNVKVNILNYGK